MKKLISLKEVESYHEEGATTIFVDSQTIITPAAKDLAEEYQMEWVERTCSNPAQTLAETDPFSKEALIALLKQFLAETGNQPYEASYHKSGLKIVKGATVKLPPVADNPCIKSQEIVHAKECGLTANLLSLEDTCYKETSGQESVNYILTGTVDLTIAGERFVAHQGDTVFIPKGTKTDWLVKGSASVLSTKLKEASRK
jgi:ethanolamine utilization protein EutQ